MNIYHLFPTINIFKACPSIINQGYKSSIRRRIEILATWKNIFGHFLIFLKTCVLKNTNRCLPWYLNICQFRYFIFGLLSAQPDNLFKLFSALFRQFNKIFLKFLFCNMSKIITNSNSNLELTPRPY